MWILIIIVKKIEECNNIKVSPQFSHKKMEKSVPGHLGWLYCWFFNKTLRIYILDKNEVIFYGRPILNYWEAPFDILGGPNVLLGGPFLEAQKILKGGPFCFIWRPTYIRCQWRTHN